ncbi:Hsp20/alpha crystallin family protein [Alicyclobacillus sp. ALC3]|uniref:Hsp20/alpha crystallin family protein n=1 Tax=Alicyclobacillus sp. ALC3 TaxID=2796143 RepID=UPI002378E90F|nr:Hsp20/alpha crystallin family protein [Alicyclobacillus sp. ALC3]WDL97066.1 Hsp20/alpha crystallin family protein [Alicyclobacillus sp. ALC3]
MNRNNRGFFDTMNNLQQMGEHMSKMFGGDFSRQWMNGFGPSQGRPSASQFQGRTSGSGPAQPLNGWSGGGFPQGGSGMPDWLHSMPGLDGITNFLGAGAGAGTAGSAGSFPPVDVYETDREVFVICDVPGIERPSGIRVSVETDRVVLRGEIKNHQGNRSGVAASLSERRTGAFERVVDLPAAVDRTKSRAVYKDGQLELRLPKLRGSQGESGRSVQVDFL